MERKDCSALTDIGNNTLLSNYGCSLLADGSPQNTYSGILLGPHYLQESVFNTSALSPKENLREWSCLSVENRVPGINHLYVKIISTQRLRYHLLLQFTIKKKKMSDSRRQKEICSLYIIYVAKRRKILLKIYRSNYIKTCSIYTILLTIIIIIIISPGGLGSKVSSEVL